MDKDSKIDVFPYNCKEGIVVASSKLFPPHTIDEFDDFNRSVVTHRLCRYIQDHLSDLDDEVLVSYALLISRLSTMGTKLETPGLLHQVQSGSMFSGVSFRDRSSPERLSDLSLGMSQLETLSSGPTPVVNDQFSMESAQNLASFFFSNSFEKSKRRYPLKEELAVLWSDAMATLKCRFPSLEELVRLSLLSRARLQGYPAAILALNL